MSDTQAKTIDEVLMKVFRAGIDTAHLMKGGLDVIMPEEAKAALSAMVTEIIGEDEKFTPNPDLNPWTNPAYSRNALRQSQRQRAIAKGFDMSERRG